MAEDVAAASTSYLCRSIRPVPFSILEVTRCHRRRPCRRSRASCALKSWHCRTSRSARPHHPLRP